MNVYEPPYGHWFEPAAGAPSDEGTGHGTAAGEDPGGAKTPGHFLNGEHELVEQKSRKHRTRRSV